MYRKISALCAFFCLALIVQSCIVSRDYNSHWNRIEFLDVPSPDSTLTMEHEPAWYEAEYTGHDAVYLEHKFSEEHVGDYTSWKYYAVSKLRYVVLNPEADWATTFRVVINDEDQNLDSVYMTITTPDGKTSHFGKSDLFIEQSGDGSTQYKFAYPDVRKGSMIEEGYIVRTTSGERRTIREHFFPIKTGVPAEKVIYKYIYPARWGLRFKRIAADAVTPSDLTFHKESNARILEIQGNNMTAWEDEAWSPYQLDVIPYLEFSVATAETRYMYLEMPLEWTKLMKGMRVDQDTYFDMREDEDLAEIARKATKNAENDFQKIDAINNWVQQNIEVGDCKNCEYDDVVRRGRGGMFTVLEITMALLDHADVESSMIMIHPANEGYFDKDYVTFTELISPGVVAYAESDTLVVYPFIKDLPAGLLPPVWQERPAVLINLGDRAQISASPIGAVSENTEEEEYDLTIDEDGLISVKERKFFRGLSAYVMRSALREAKENEMEDFMAELLTYEEGNVELGEYTIENLDDYRQPLEITLNYTIDNLVTVTPEEVIFQTGGLFSPSSERKIKIETDDRVNPIRIYSDEEVIKRITISHPPEWKLETKLKPVEFDNQFGELDATYTSESGRFTAEQRRLLKKASEPKEKIDDLMMITSRRSQLWIPTLIFAVTGK